MVVSDRTEMTFYPYWSFFTVPERHFYEIGRLSPYQNDILKISYVFQNFFRPILDEDLSLFTVPELHFPLFWSPIAVPERHFSFSGRLLPYRSDIRQSESHENPGEERPWMASCGDFFDFGRNRPYRNDIFLTHGNGFISTFLTCWS